MVFLMATFLSLIGSSLAACNVTALRAEIAENCKGASSGSPCPEACVTSLATTCPKAQQAELAATRNEFAFCNKPATATTSGKGKVAVASTGKSVCFLKRTKQACVGNCQWCVNECQPVRAKGKCRQKCADDPNKALVAAGYDCASLLEVLSNNCGFDLGQLSPDLAGVTPFDICLKSCSNCVAATSSSSSSSSSSTSSSSSSTSATSPTASCKDDAAGYLSSRGFDCAMLIQVSNNNCDFDLTALSSEIPKGTTPALLCPATCKRCDKSSSSSAGSTDNGAKNRNTNATACKDDPTGMVAQYGFNCAAVLAATGNNCQTNLHSLVPSVPQGVTPAQLCPASCGLCPSSNNQTKVAPPKPNPKTYINGREVGPDGKGMLEGLGVPVPAGRYFLRADGSVGPEGGPAVANVYSAVGNKIDQGVTRGYNEVQTSAIQTGDKIKTFGDQTKTKLDEFGAQTKTKFDEFGGQVKASADNTGAQIRAGLDQIAQVFRG